MSQQWTTAKKKKVYTNDEIKVVLDDIFSGKNVSEIKQINDKARVIQRAVRSFLFRKKIRSLVSQYRESDVAKPQRQRIKIVREIVSSEEVYVNALTQIMNEFYLPLLELEKHKSLFSSKAITLQEHQQIFSNINVIYEFHARSFLPSLQEELKNWPANPVLIGKKITTLAPYLKLYTVYSNNFDNSMKVIDECKKKGAFSKWLLAQETKISATLSSFLINPIQRVPRYKLLLQELLKFTSEDHVDYNDIKIGLEEISKVAKHLNASKGASENITSVESKQKDILGLPLNFAHAQRKYIQEGFLSRNLGGKPAELENRFYYLFNDLLLSTKYDNSRNERAEKLYDGYILLRDSTLIDLPGKQFSIRFANGKVMEYTCRSPAEKEEWMKGLREAADYLSQHPKETSPDLLLEFEHFGTGTCKISGFLDLSKKGLIFKGFTPLWLKLESNVLYIYKKKDRSKLFEVLQLENYSVTRLSHLSKPSFQLTHDDVFYVFVGQSQEEITHWVKSIEDAKKDEASPITDLCLIHLDRGECCPLGYIPIMRTWHNHSGNLNEYSKGHEIILCYQKNAKSEKLPITEIGIGMLDSDNILRRRWYAEDIPQIWTKIDKTFYGNDGNLNSGGSGRDIYLYYKREEKKSAITKISFYCEGIKLPTGSVETLPTKFIPIRYTITGSYYADLNSGNGGQPTFICLQKDNEMECYLQKELGWDPFVGYKKSHMSTTWQNFTNQIGIQDEELTREFLLNYLDQVDKAITEIKTQQTAPRPLSLSQPVQSNYRPPTGPASASFGGALPVNNFNPSQPPQPSYPPPQSNTFNQPPFQNNIPYQPPSNYPSQYPNVPTAYPSAYPNQSPYPYQQGGNNYSPYPQQPIYQPQPYPNYSPYPNAIPSSYPAYPSNYPSNLPPQSNYLSGQSQQNFYPSNQIGSSQQLFVAPQIIDSYLPPSNKPQQPPPQSISQQPPPIPSIPPPQSSSSSPSSQLQIQSSQSLQSLPISQSDSSNDTSPDSIDFSDLTPDQYKQLVSAVKVRIANFKKC